MKDFFVKVKSIIKTIDYRHYICAGITIVFILLNIFVFQYSFLRIWESVIDFGTSCAYYFRELTGLRYDVTVTVNELSKMPFKPPFNLPETWELFCVRWDNYWTQFVTEDNFIKYHEWLSNVLYWISQILIIIMPFITIFLVLKAFKEEETNNNYNVDTKPLQVYKKFLSKVYEPIRDWIVEFMCFVKENKAYKTIWLWIWALNFNVVAMVIEFIAFYLYFVASFDFLNLYRQVYKLLVDLSVAINFIPGIVWFIIGFIVFDKICKIIGYARLQHHEAKNCGWTNERAICLLIVGEMGKGKTTALSDVSLSQDVMFRDKAFEKILECDLKFPYFPWIELENDLKKAIEKHKIYTLASCREFIDKRYKRFMKKPIDKNLYGYDYNRYGYTYDNKLYVTDIWEVIKDYAQLYFIYIVESSFIVSNYSIRTDNVKQDLGNFPLWDTDFFKRDSRLIDAYSRHSHILDFDAFRLGKKFVDNNKYADYLEFGVFNMTEIGKERGNALDLQELKKKTDETNQKNDMFNARLKLIRHHATVDGYPFVRILTDEQRMASWGADARELCDVVNIDEKCEFQLTLPGFHLRDLVISWFLDKFQKAYYTHRFYRGDNTLGVYIYKQVVSKLYSYRLGIYNTFGYNKLKIAVSKGTQDGAVKDTKYYLCHKKIYAKRFSTDCYSDIFTSKTLRSAVGLADVPEYKGVKATLEELASQNSYFFGDLLKIKNNDIEKKE